ncbi:tellurite resistance protein TrgA [Cereibacter johrii]|uniref:tellurite resistance protein TrgA n=1 Tax=Cereibacter johrii TaxID=445629 RepID=UPI000C6D7F3B|nr:tellurite resistance protein TrgA [Cereibacter johrii]RAZ87624.1 tellurium resistance protein [Cereibacter johrii]
MPTAAKLVAALAFAALGYLGGRLFAGEVPEGTPTALFGPWGALAGLLCGWAISGARAGRGYWPALGTGVRTVVTGVFLALLGYSLYIMVLRAMRMLYDGPIEALLGVFALMLDQAQLLARPEIVGTLALGGMIAGSVTEWAGRRWK